MDRAPGTNRLLLFPWACPGGLGIAWHQGDVKLFCHLALDCLCGGVCYFMTVDAEQENVVAAVGFHVQREMSPVAGRYYSVPQKMRVIATCHAPAAMQLL